jgi:signal peptidase II
MIFLFLSCAMALLLDQWSKRAVDARVSAGISGVRHIPVIRRVTNRKRVYRHGGVRAGLAGLWFAALVSAIVLNRTGVRFQTHVALLGLGAALGGAAGNLLDVIRYRGIRDFIDLRRWPVFNLADIAVIAGLIVAIWARP